MKRAHRILCGGIFLLLDAPLACAGTIVSVTTEDQFLGREVVTPGCAWIDNFQRTTTTVTAEAGGGSGNVYSIRSGDGEMYVDYEGFPNPCVVKGDPRVPHFWYTPEGQASCFRPPDVAVTESSGGGGGTGVRTMTATDISYFSTFTNICEGKECHKKPPPVVVDEPKTLVMWGIGLILLGKQLRKFCGFA